MSARRLTSALLSATHDLLDGLSASAPLSPVAACVLLEIPLLDDPEHSACAHLHFCCNIFSSSHHLDCRGLSRACAPAPAL